MKDNSQFKRWLNHMWFDHKNEFEIYNQKFPDYTREDYFKKYKWWLKREFIHRQRKGVIKL